MTSVATRDGKVILKNGSVGLETSCCCGADGGSGDPCTCANLLFYVVVRVTFSRAYGICGLIEFDTPVEFLIDSTLPCVNGTFTAQTDIDISLCSPDQYCEGANIFFSIVDPPCNCAQGTNSCQVEITGWEEVDCNGGITSIELLQ